MTPTTGNQKLQNGEGAALHSRHHDKNKPLPQQPWIFGSSKCRAGEQP